MNSSRRGAEKGGGFRPPTLHQAFAAGWMAAHRSIDHEWGPAPPNDLEEAFTKWYNRRHLHLKKG